MYRLLSNTTTPQVVLLNVQKVYFSISSAGFEESCGAFLGGELDAWVQGHSINTHKTSIVIF